MVLRHVSILRDHPQGVCLYHAEVTERMAPQGSQHTPATFLLPQSRVNHRDFKFSVLNFKKILKNF
jgi:hypothetical protein